MSNASTKKKNPSYRARAAVLERERGLKKKKVVPSFRPDALCAAYTYVYEPLERFIIYLIDSVLYYTWTIAMLVLFFSLLYARLVVCDTRKQPSEILVKVWIELGR